MLQILYVLLCFYGLAKLLAFLRKNSVVQSDVTPTSRTGDYVNKLVLACILVPTGVWAVEKIQPYFVPQKLITDCWRMGDRAGMSLRELLHGGLQAELKEEVSRVENEIAEIEQSIADIEAFDPQWAAQRRDSLQPLKSNLARLLELKGKEVTDLGKQVIADLDRKIIQTKAKSSQDELQLTFRKSRIEYDSALTAARSAKNPAATQVINHWLDAVVQHDLAKAKNLMTEEAAAQLTPHKVGQLRDRIRNVESMQVTRRGGRLGFTIGEGAGHDLLFVGIHSEGDRVAIDAVEF